MLLIVDYVVGVNMYNTVLIILGVSLTSCFLLFIISGFIKSEKASTIVLGMGSVILTLCVVVSLCVWAYEFFSFRWLYDLLLHPIKGFLSDRVIFV